MKTNSFRMQYEASPKIGLEPEEIHEMRLAYLSGHLALCGYNPNDAKALTPEAADLMYEASIKGWVPLSEINYLFEVSLQERGALASAPVEIA